MRFIDIKLIKDRKWKVTGVKLPFDTLVEAEDYVSKLKNADWVSHVINGSSGDLMKYSSWREDCDNDCFIDYDGHGDILDENYELLESASPSDTQSDATIKRAKYVLWFNK